jgi:AcrR family transcriptional regulator
MEADHGPETEPDRYRHIQIEAHDRVGLIRLCRSAARNALGAAEDDDKAAGRIDTDRVAPSLSRRRGAVRGSTRQAILDAAETLFYGEGIRGATMDRIAARAGLTKRTLYHHFRSKDDLVAAVLSQVGGAERDHYAVVMQNAAGSGANRVRSLFAALAQDVRDPRWKGCCFARAAGELAGLPGHPGIVVARAHRKAIETWLATLLAHNGMSASSALARRIILLLDGAIVQGFLHHDPAYVLLAGEMASEQVAARDRSHAA